MILLVDNYDSFTFNLAQLVRAAAPSRRLLVVRNDERDAGALLALRPWRVILSPGPGSPDDAGVSVALARACDVPLLGVCLGHQCLAAAFGARVTRAPRPVHGFSDEVLHDRRGVFAAMDSPFVAGRYHSLAVDGDGVPDALEVCAVTPGGVVMGIRHRSRPLHGVQFHPESVLTPDGPRLVARFLSEGFGLPADA